MIIEKIDIKSFGRITDLSLSFAEGVNVLEGENESGKSTIAAFIKYMLYGFDVKGDGEDTDERRRRLNWETGICQGTMTVRVGEKKYVVSRTTVPTQTSGRITYKEDSSIIDLDTGAPAFGKIAAGEVFFGVDRELFENTAFVGQLYDSKIDEGSVRQSIENILFSGSEKINNQRAAAKIGDKMHALLHDNNMGGAIVDLAKRHDQLSEKLKSSDADNKRILEKETELHEIKMRKASAENTYKKYTDLDECYKNAMLIQTFDRLHELELESDKKAEAYAEFIEVNTRAGFVPDEKYLSDIVTARMAVNDTYHNLTETSDEYSRQRNAAGITRESEGMIELSDSFGSEEKVAEVAHAYHSSKMKGLAFGISGAALAIAAVVLGLLIPKLGQLSLILSIVSGALAAVAIGFFLYKFIGSSKKLSALLSTFSTSSYSELKSKLSAVKEDRKKRDDMLTSTAAAKSAQDTAREAYERAKNDLKTVILRWGEEPPVSELNVFLDALEQRVRVFLEKKTALFAEKENIELTVKDIRRTLSETSEIDIRAQVSPLKRKALAGVNHDEIITGISECRAKIAAEERLIYNVENELFALKARAGEPGDYYAGMASVEDKIEDLQAKHKAYFIAKRAIEGASDNLRREISPRLGEYSTALMEIMTDKKYSEIDVTDGLKVTFTAPDGEKKSVDFLSGGTRDLTYIAVRMALIDMLYSEKPPVTFDESFAHQDDTRARSMMKGLAKLTEEGIQSFVFTCHSREAALARECISGAGIYKLSVSDGE